MKIIAIELVSKIIILNVEKPSILLNDGIYKKTTT